MFRSKSCQQVEMISGAQPGGTGAEDEDVHELPHEPSAVQRRLQTGGYLFLQWVPALRFPGLTERCRLFPVGVFPAFGSCNQDHQKVWHGEYIANCQCKGKLPE